MGKQNGVGLADEARAASSEASDETRRAERRVAAERDTEMLMATEPDPDLAQHIARLPTAVD